MKRPPREAHDDLGCFAPLAMTSEEEMAADALLPGVIDCVMAELIVASEVRFGGHPKLGEGSMDTQTAPFIERSARVGFGVNPLDRLSERRDDTAFLQALEKDSASRSVVIAQDRPILRKIAGGHDPFFTLAETASLGAARVTALLGQLDGQGPVFATLLEDSAVEMVLDNSDGSFLDKRSMVVPGHDDLAVPDMRSVVVLGLVPPPVAGMLGQAKSLMYWHARHRYCPNCGSLTRVAGAGWRRECDTCKMHHFPRTDPVVIMLAVDGERCLLGRQPRFPKGMYSCLAGFLEAGETIEAAVRREILEEAGVRTGRVTYLASQPWPFPASLMIGCLAQAVSSDVTIDKAELEDARWFTRDEARAMLEGRHADGLASPQGMAIAHHLLRAWAFEAAAP